MKRNKLRAAVAVTDVWTFGWKEREREVESGGERERGKNGKLGEKQQNENQEKNKYKMTDAIHKQFAIQQLKGSAVTSAFAALHACRGNMLRMRLQGGQMDCGGYNFCHPKRQPYTCFGSVWCCQLYICVLTHKCTLHFVIPFSEEHSGRGVQYVQIVRL